MIRTAQPRSWNKNQVAYEKAFARKFELVTTFPNYFMLEKFAQQCIDLHCGDSLNGISARVYMDKIIEMSDKEFVQWARDEFIKSSKEYGEVKVSWSPKGKKHKQVEQQCSACGHRFFLMYWEDGTYTYLDDPCECHADYFSLGPSISEWLQEIKEGNGTTKSKTFSYDDLNWSEQEIARVRQEAMNLCAEENGSIEQISGYLSYTRNGDPYYGDPSCWPKLVVYWE